MRVTIGWQGESLNEGDEYFLPLNSGGSMGGYGGSRPSGFGIVDPSIRVTLNTEGDAEYPSAPLWWGDAEIHTEVTFTPANGGPVLSFVWGKSSSYPEGVTYDQRLVEQSGSWELETGTYELRMFVDGVPSLNRLFMSAFSEADGGAAYGSVLWSGEEPVEPPQPPVLFWSKFRGTKLLTEADHA